MIAPPERVAVPVALIPPAMFEALNVTAGAGAVYYVADTYFCPDCLTSAGSTIIRFSSTPGFTGYGVLGGAYYQLLFETTGPNFDVDGDFLTQVSNCNVACSG